MLSAETTITRKTLFYLLTQTTGILSLLSFYSGRYHIRMGELSSAKQINLLRNKRECKLTGSDFAYENELQM